MSKSLTKPNFTTESSAQWLPHVSVDCVVFGFHADQLRVLLLRFKNTDDWCVPGGRIYRTESVQAAAYRVLEQRTGLKDIFLQQFQTFGANDRMQNTDFQTIFARQGIHLEDNNVILDRTVSVGYYALVEYSKVKPIPDSFTEECLWWEVSELPKLIFDHQEMIEKALQILRQQLRYQPIGINLLPDKFTMPEMQKLYETILGKRLDRRNFQKRMLGYNILQRLEERRTGGAHKSPYLYRFDEQRYHQALADGWGNVW